MKPTPSQSRHQRNLGKLLIGLALFGSAGSDASAEHPPTAASTNPSPVAQPAARPMMATGCVHCGSHGCGHGGLGLRWPSDWLSPPQLLAPGNLAPRYPYQAFGPYYYDRPYNQAHVRTSGPTGSDVVRPVAKLPYSNQMFEDLAVRLDQRWQAEAAVSLQADDVQQAAESLLQRDKYLEYVDWRTYRAARERWELEQSAEEELPAQND